MNRSISIRMFHSLASACKCSRSYWIYSFSICTIWKNIYNLFTIETLDFSLWWTSLFNKRIDEFLIDINANGLDIRRQCLSNEEIQKEELKQIHKYLISDELEILNKRVHNSIIDSIKNDAKTFGNNSTKVANFFDIFGEFMLYAGCDILFGQSFKYGIFRIPLWKIFYRSVYEKIVVNSLTDFLH